MTAPPNLTRAELESAILSAWACRREPHELCPDEEFQAWNSLMTWVEKVTGLWLPWCTQRDVVRCLERMP